LAHDEINPLVMSVSGVLFGLGTDYGVHLWSRFTEEIDKGYSPVKASSIACEQTGPPVVIGAVTNILAFLCLCLSRDTGLFQLGYIGAIGLVLTLVASLFLFPAIVALLANSKKSYYPRMRPRIGSFARVFGNMPGMTVFISGVVLAIVLFGSVRVSYEKDLFKATYARDMDSTATAQWISGKFGVDFSQPTLLFFDAPNLNEGLTIQRQVDHILRELKQRNHEIVLFDSVSNLMAPELERQANLGSVSRILDQWPELKATFLKLVSSSMLSQASAETMKRSFVALHDLLEALKVTLATQKEPQLAGPEIKDYIARVGSNYRFLTRILFSGDVLNSEEMNETHKQITAAMTGLPVQVNTCSPRQAMAEYIQNTNSEVFRLGLLVVVAVIIFFFALFRHPTMIALSLTPMLGAFASVFGVMGYIGNGLPNSMVAVAPLIFGLSMDNGVHVVMGSVQGLAPSVIKTMEHITRPILFISTTNVLGFVALLTSRHYPLEFLGWAMLIGTAASVFLSLVTLPAILLTMERRKSRI
jgi:predicted RND superfamily exporter protein